ncbi:cystathionine beta-lyase, putative [Metarhizium acridum CQMa 102]|uniref:Cystathionine beta-lyase, putative n=1 Tax=Metarhizium acridum (strain CQMa 102) TaxID=655827 RepID=E9EGW4_METAQ|nr:cystathionine beta-lyase, putative [Metarhizium acridum CQMa 102]EFY84860.1 cystathionine beta-lyase, putative [Metarhizium acridum CQMa 102]
MSLGGFKLPTKAVQACNIDINAVQVPAVATNMDLISSKMLRHRPASFNEACIHNFLERDGKFAFTASDTYRPPTNAHLAYLFITCETQQDLLSEGTDSHHHRSHSETQYPPGEQHACGGSPLPQGKSFTASIHNTIGLGGPVLAMETGLAIHPLHPPFRCRGLSRRSRDDQGSEFRGTNFTLACPYTVLAHYKELEWAAQFGVWEHLVRTSVGIEDKHVTCQTLANALAAAEQHCGD